MARIKPASTVNKATDVDSNYKHLFSCPEVVRDLLKGFVPGKWIKEADFSSLTHVSGSYVSEAGKQRHGDAVWKLNINGRWLWVYIILEFQSESESWMALRIMEYVSQLSLQITREIKKDELPEGRIPPILPIVLYNGLREWNAATDVADCYIEAPGGLEAFQPKLRYLLLDAHRLKLNRAAEIRNFAEAVFRMEANQGTADLFAVIKALAEVLHAPELESLRRAFNVWIKGLLKRHTPDTKIVEKISGIKDIFKEHDMAEATYLNWADVFKAEGKAEGKAEILFRLLTRRFGALPKWAEKRLNKAKPAQLEEWADAVLDASNLTEVLGAPSRR
jgi:hypothetical protein